MSVGILLGAAVPQASADLFDAANDFSITSNPNGVWSYGTTGTTLTGSFTPFSTAVIGTGVNAGIDAWEGTVPMFGGFFPIVGKNTTNTTVSPPNQVLLPEEMWIHPGPDGSYAVVRFTAPTTETFTVSATFEGRAPTNEGFPAGTTTDVHVRLNGVSLFDGNVNGFGPSSDQSMPSMALSLHAGDHLDFVAGYGSNQNFLNDTTGLEATIVNAVPEPSTFILTAIGSLAFVIAGRRRSGATRSARRAHPGCLASSRKACPRPRSLPAW
jgi:hypothetical protein